MALKQSIIYKGINIPEAYHKISNYFVNESGVTNGVKKYNVTVYISTYTDSTKENSLYSEDFMLNDIPELGLTLQNIYTQIKLKEKFNTSVDI